MAVQYPHIIQLKFATSEPEMVSGEWVFSEPEIKEYPCRAEASTGNSTIGTESGEAVFFEFMVYLPKMTDEHEEGTDCTLKLSETKQIKTTIKRHYNGQLNSRIWL